MKYVNPMAVYIGIYFSIYDEPSLSFANRRGRNMPKVSEEYFENKKNN